MKLPCNVTQDLLPLYHDGVCSQESRTMVEEHLSSCQSCQKLLDDLNTQPLPEAYIDDAAALKALKKQWGKSLAKSFAKGLGLACLVCALIWGAWYGLTQWKFIPVPSDALSISQVYQLKTGQIVFNMEIMDGREIMSTYFGLEYGEDGAAVYVTPKRSIIEGKVWDYQKVTTHLIDLDAFQPANHAEITAIYVGSVEDAILVWEKGMELPHASQEQENYWAGEFSNPFNSYLNG